MRQRTPEQAMATIIALRKKYGMVNIGKPVECAMALSTAPQTVRYWLEALDDAGVEKSDLSDALILMQGLEDELPYRKNERAAEVAKIIASSKECAKQPAGVAEAPRPKSVNIPVGSLYLKPGPNTITEILNTTISESGKTRTRDEVEKLAKEYADARMLTKVSYKTGDVYVPPRSR